MVGARQMNKVGQGELIPSKVIALTKPLLVDFQNFLQLPLLSVDVFVVVVILIMKWEGNMAEQCSARRVEGMLLVPEPLFNGGPLKDILSQEERIPLVLVDLC